MLHGVGRQLGEHEGHRLGDFVAVLGHHLAQEVPGLTDRCRPTGERPTGAQQPVSNCADIAGGGSGLAPVNGLAPHTGCIGSFPGTGAGKQILTLREHGIGVSYPLPGLDSALVEERYESELTRSATVLDGVDAALERLSKGSYGTCDTCGSAILDADLESDPTRRHCEQHLEFAEPEGSYIEPEGSFT